MTIAAPIPAEWAPPFPVEFGRELNPRWFPRPLYALRTAPRKAVLLAPFTFVSPTHGEITAEAEFDTDWASVPRPLWSLYPPDGEYAEAAVIHDWGYWYQPAPRDVVDSWLLQAMEALGVPWHRRRIIHSAVHAGGWAAWNRNKKKRA